MKKSFYLYLLLIIAAAACKKPYDPPAISGPNGYLVVEGVINSGTDSTFIKLSRTVNIDSAVTSRPELHAIVSVEGDQNTSYPLIEMGNGRYACRGLNLDNSHKYRLNILTSNLKQYLSDYTAPLNSPPMDSVSYDTKGALAVPGLNLYASTHDPSGKVLYYRWAYGETWMIHAAFPSFFYSNGDTVLARNLINDGVTYCWQHDTSSNIVLGSTAKLSTDIIKNIPLLSIASTSEKVGDEYSIIVTQYALTADAFNFYTNLKKITEELGSIFDAQPSQISGNIHSVSNPSEPVIGYITVGATASRRIFISNRILPKWTTIPFYSGCKLEFEWPKFPCCYYAFFEAGSKTPENQVDEYINYNKGHFSTPYIPLDALGGAPGQPPIGYTATTRECGDCTVRGSNRRPVFWQ